MPQTPSPENMGWISEGDSDSENVSVLKCEWMKGKPALEAVLDLMACSCKKECKNGDCPCVTNGLKCTDMCKNTSCENQCLEDDVDDDVSSDDNYDSDGCY